MTMRLNRHVFICYTIVKRLTKQSKSELNYLTLLIYFVSIKIILSNNGSHFFFLIVLQNSLIVTLL